jgi:hypothetical protein
MPPLAKHLLLCALLIAIPIACAHAQQKTVCSITVNSSDELQTFRRNLPADKFRFVELVTRGRPDWLASACRAGIRCDVLVISGHYDGRDEFYSEHLGAEEFLPVNELERVSCSASCSQLFSQLKEVYLFGCNTLNPEAAYSTSTEIERRLVSLQQSPARSGRAESNRDRMRAIFKNVPVIYGFSAKAPVGPAAASTLGGYFHAAGPGEIGSARVSSRLLGRFAANSMTVVAGMTSTDPRAEERREACTLYDDRLSAAQKLDFVHRVLGGDVAQLRLFLDRIERYAATLGEAERRTPEIADALDRITRDEVARTRYLELERDASPPPIRARLIALAGNLGWLTPEEQRAETLQMFEQLLAGGRVTASDADLACRLNAGGQLARDASPQPPPAQLDRPASAAVLACLGNADARQRVLTALTSSDPAEIGLAHVYLQHRPITDPAELHRLTIGIAGMRSADAQMLALDALALQHVTDAESVDALAGLFAVTESPKVQSAVAGVLLRADYEAVDTEQLAQLLRERRLKSASGGEVIDVLIRHLAARPLLSQN